MNPFLATYVFTDFKSVSKLMLKPEDDPGLFTGAGAPLSSFEQACAKQARQATEKLPVSVVKNSLRFISLKGFIHGLNLKTLNLFLVYPVKIYPYR
jgi:hypothetical protein